MVKLLKLVLVALAVLLADAAEEEPTYDEYKTQYGLKFDPIEDAYRKTVYDTTLSYIRGHNNEEGKTYFEGTNRFSYLTGKEFTKMFFELTLPICVEFPESAEQVPIIEAIKNSSSSKVTSKPATPEKINATNEWNPTPVDWTTVANVITPVKDQADCGACYSFSAVAAIESLLYLTYGTVGADLSEQQIVDCSAPHGNLGCNGGDMINAFNYVKDVGLTTETAHPYKGVASPSCQVTQGAFKISGYTQVTEGDCKALAAALVLRPIAVGVDAGNWQYYKNGTFSNCTNEPNHGVLLVGANRLEWKIKNSWGAGWGEKGFIRLSAVNGNNTCNICFSGVYPNA